MQLLRKILLVFSFTFSLGVVMAQNETETLVQTLQTANFSNLLSFWDAASEVNILDQSAQKHPSDLSGSRWFTGWANGQ